MIFFKRSQSSFFDFIVGFFVFSIVLVLFFSASKTYYYSEKDFSYVSNIILSDGIPNDWNESYYYKPGVLSNNKLNETKFLMLYNLSKKDSLKNIFKTNFLFFLYKHNESNFSNIIFIPVSNVSYISTDYNVSFYNVSNFKNVKVEDRIVNYNNSLYNVKFVFWS